MFFGIEKANFLITEDINYQPIRFLVNSGNLFLFLKIVFVKMLNKFYFYIIIKMYIY